jgi:hypothetical protein
MMYVSKHDHLYEKTIASQSIYEGRIIKVKVDEVLLPNGHTAKREIVNHQGAVAVLPLTDDGKMVAVRQFRKPLERTIVEIPAGKLEPGEEPPGCKDGNGAFCLGKQGAKSAWLRQSSLPIFATCTFTSVEQGAESQ